MGDHSVGAQARLMSQAMRKITGNIGKSGCTVIFLNQLRLKIGITYGNPETTTGGNALKFYASVRLDIRRIQTLKRGTEEYGIRAKVKVAKNVVFLTQLHGIRPPHLGHQNVGRNGALGEVQQVIPQLNELLVDDKPLVLWLLEGQVLSKSELLAINNLCQKEPRIKIVIEMGGARSIKWQPLNEFINILFSFSSAEAKIFVIGSSIRIANKEWEEQLDHHYLR